jgi:GTP-binding protein
MQNTHLRNIAVIAHVDHGKTTLVDALLKQAHTFAQHEAEMQQTTIMDSQELERERGVTIIAKNTAIEWQDYKINILDTPGHADFAGEVERVLTMADGCLLLIDSAEGVLSQTKYVLTLALEQNLKPIVLINKIDRKDQRTQEVENEISNLFLELAEHESQLDFPVLYSIGRDGIAGYQTETQPDHSLKITDSTNLEPLFQAIIDHVPAPSGNPEQPFQLQVTNITYDNHQGNQIIGRIAHGQIKANDPITILRQSKQISRGRVEHLYTFKGLQKQAIQTASAGEIILISGITDTTIGDTITDPQHPNSLPDLKIAPPTMRIEISVSNSPLVGKEGQYSTARQIANRLEQERNHNVSLKIKSSDSGDKFLVSGRGELHLSVLIETMRREGYEFSVSRPQVIIKEVNDQTHEPWELVTIAIPEQYSGTVITAMNHRKADMQDMATIGGNVRIKFKISTRNLIGYRSELLTQTSGHGILHSHLIGYEPKGPDSQQSRNGVIVAIEPGAALAYSLNKVQERAQTLISPGTQVYKGMIVGLNSRIDNIYMNVCKGKKLTNMRAASGDDIIKLAPPIHMSLEQYLTFLADDELLEVTPKNLRLRKRNLNFKI